MGKSSFEITSEDRRQVNGDSLTENIGINQKEIQWRKKFTRFSSEEEEILESMSGIFEEIADDLVNEFYGHLEDYEETKEILDMSSKSLHSIQNDQKKYLTELGSGQYGQRYFKVVANEVKSLAEESQQNASEIEETVEEIQSQTEETASSLGTATRQVEEGLEQVKETHEKLGEILTTVQESAQGIKEVSQATDDQASTTEEVATMINSFADELSEMADEMDEIADANEKQSRRIQEVTDTVDRLQ